MRSTDPILEHVSRRLGGRPLPDDLLELLNLQGSDAASGSANPLKEAGITFLDGDQLPAVIAAACAGETDLEGASRLAYAQAMRDMVRYSGFVAEDATGSPIGYWFGPDQIPIESAPIMRYDTKGNFCILPGDGIAEAVSAVASGDSNLIFLKLRGYLNKHGFTIKARTLDDIRRRACSASPQMVFQQLLRDYSADLSAASIPHTGDPVYIMNIERGPELGPSGETR